MLEVSEVYSQAASSQGSICLCRSRKVKHFHYIVYIWHYDVIKVATISLFHCLRFFIEKSRRNNQMFEVFGLKSFDKTSQIFKKKFFSKIEHFGDTFSRNYWLIVIFFSVLRIVKVLEIQRVFRFEIISQRKYIYIYIYIYTKKKKICFLPHFFWKIVS